MKLFKEKSDDGDYYLEILLSQEDLEKIKSHFLLTDHMKIGNLYIEIGILIDDKPDHSD